MIDSRLLAAGWNWPHGRSKSYAVGIIPKAASQSVAAALPIHYGIPTVTTILFIRDPIERHASCFRFFRDTMRNHSVRDYRVFTDSVLDGTCKVAPVHWLPQTLLWAGVPATVHKFEQLADVWREVGFPCLPHINKTNPAALPDYRRDDLLQFYADDLRARGDG